MLLKFATCLFAVNKEILAFVLEVQSLFMERCLCYQLTLPGCWCCWYRLCKFLTTWCEFQYASQSCHVFQRFAGSKDISVFRTSGSVQIFTDFYVLNNHPELARIVLSFRGTVWAAQAWIIIPASSSSLLSGPSTSEKYYELHPLHFFSCFINLCLSFFW